MAVYDTEKTVCEQYVRAGRRGWWYRIDYDQYNSEGEGGIDCDQNNCDGPPTPPQL